MQGQPTFMLLFSLLSLSVSVFVLYVNASAASTAHVASSTMASRPVRDRKRAGQTKTSLVRSQNTTPRLNTVDHHGKKG